jgi:hypothetical protein
MSAAVTGLSVSNAIGRVIAARITSEPASGVIIRLFRPGAPKPQALASGFSGTGELQSIR